MYSYGWGWALDKQKPDTGKTLEEDTCALITLQSFCAYAATAGPKRVVQLMIGRVWDSDPSREERRY